MKLQLIILNGQNVSSKNLFYYDAAYLHWKKIWQSTFQELDGNPHILSDNFTRQSEIISIFWDSKCIASVCHRYVPNLSPTFEDSYFTSWDEKSLQSIKNFNSYFAIGSQISIDQEFRSSNLELRIKDLLLWVSLRRIVEKKIPYTIGTVRNNKGMDKLFSRFGAKILDTSHLHGVVVSLLYFKLDEIQLTHPGLDQAHELFKLKIEDQFANDEDTILNRLNQFRAA